MTVTMYTMPQMAILPAAVKKDKERNKIITMGAGCCALAFTIGNTFTQNITGFFNSLGFSNGYIPFMLICGLLAFISFWGLFKSSKGQERYLSEPEKNPFKGIGMVLKHKEVYPNIIAWVMASMGYGLPSTIGACLASGKKKTVSGIGIRNVRDRLILIYGQRADFDIVSISESGTTVTITLPLAYSEKDINN